MRATSGMIPEPCCGPAASAVRMRNVGSCMACLIMPMLYTGERSISNTTLSIGEYSADVLAEDLANAGAYDTGGRRGQQERNWPHPPGGKGTARPVRLLCHN